MTQPLILTDSQRGYLAGLFDGEGCVTIARRHQHRSGAFAMTLEALLVMDDEKTIRYVHETTGLGTVTVDHRVDAAGTTSGYRWATTSGSASLFLQALRPLLLTKADEADVAIEFASLLTGGRVSREVWTRRNTLYQDLRALKPSSRLRSSSANDERCNQWIAALPW